MKPSEIRDWRLKHALTQEQLAMILGVQRYTVQRWEWDQRTPPYMLVYALERLDQIVDTPLAELHGISREQLAREALGLV